MNRLRLIFPYALAMLCIVSGGIQLFTNLRESGLSSTPTDMVSPWEEHIEPLRQALSPDVYAAGYLDASDVPGSLEPVDDAELGLSQYALAPMALRHGPGGPWIIGNFGGSASLKTIRPWLARTLGEFTIQDFGFGLYLIHVTGQ